MRTIEFIKEEKAFLYSWEGDKFRWCIFRYINDNLVIPIASGGYLTTIIEFLDATDKEDLDLFAFVCDD